MSCVGFGSLPRLAAGLVLTACFAAPARAQSSVDDFRAKVENWVETRQILSEEASEWEVGRETLQATKKLLAQQQESLAAQVKELDETSSAADDERTALLLERGELQRASTELEAQIGLLEQQAMALALRLPEPLRVKLEPLLVQIPENPEITRVPLGQRLMNVLGVLDQAEKFNGTATFVGETRAVGEGEQKVQIRTLYWGLAQAVYVDAQGRTAGIGRPGPEGWEFSTEPTLAGDAERLLDIYEGNVDVIEFVRLPAEIR